MFSVLKKLFGTANDRIIKKLQKEIEKINELENLLKNLSDEELKAKTNEFKTRLSKGVSVEDITYDAFACVREAAKRIYNMRHFDVQLIGGLLLHRGYITEMRTGEGKTLVATLPAYLNALSSKGVHVVTVNDYLATRDSAWMGKIYNFLGLSVGKITANMSEEERKAAYLADITYATNNELGFDFLRDNMKYDEESKVLRPFNYAIIDEVDSILIDEARTPLIISGPVDDNTDLYLKIDKLVRKLTNDDFEKDEKLRTINLTEKGVDTIEDLFIKNQLIAEGSSLYDIRNLSLVHFINQSLKAHNLYTKDVDYLIKDNKVIIIDEFTGRMMEGRRYSEGLHQALEAKEGVKIQKENQTLASITFQNYFRMYPKLSGMTGTAMTESAELKDIYNLDVVAVPTNNTVTRIDQDDEIYGTKLEKYRAILELIKDCYERKQPVLVGTVSIEKSEEISKLLNDNKIKHKVLNAKFHEQEAHIIAQAGRLGAVTIATNMAGRGTDIKLGGNAEMIIEEFNNSNDTKKIEEIEHEIALEKEEVIKAGGLFVIGTERHESRRIDNQLRGRSGRQGDPGFTKFFLSLEDDLMRIFASDKISGLLRTLGLKDGEAIQHPMISRSLEKAQKKVESHNYEIRKNLLRFDDVMNEQRKVIYEQRAGLINSGDVDNYISSIAEDVINDKILLFIKEGSYREEWDLEGLAHEINRIFAIKINPNELLLEDGAEKEIVQKILSLAIASFSEKKSIYGDEMISKIARYVLLTTIDQVWKDHLHSLDMLRQGISLRAYGQKDPLTEYKREAFNLFESMLENLKELFVERVFHLHLALEQNPDSIKLAPKNKQEMHETRQDPALVKYGSAIEIETKIKQVKSFVDPDLRDPSNPESWGKISRNDACPCGSGKKYKHCHGQA